MAHKELIAKRNNESSFQYLKKFYSNSHYPHKKKDSLNFPIYHNMLLCHDVSIFWYFHIIENVNCKKETQKGCLIQFNFNSIFWHSKNLWINNYIFKKKNYNYYSKNVCIYIIENAIAA